MDGDGFSTEELATNFRDIRRVNRWFGGTSAILSALPELISSDIKTFTLLDLATGVADIPLAVQQWARAHGREVDIVATDISPEILTLARVQVGGSAGITLLEADARQMPFASRSFDVVTCSLALHHFSRSDAVRVVTEMDRLGRAGFIVNDLRRDRIGYGATWLASRTTTRNRLTRHDAPLSMRRAYTPTELRAILADAGVWDAEVCSLPWFRMIAIKRATHE